VKEPGKSHAPPSTGTNRMADGTVIQIAGSSKISGDPIRSETRIQDRKISMDAEGVAAVRLNGKGRLEAMATGGLNHFKAGDFEISIDTRADLALWIDSKGQWHGVLQNENGPIPESLLKITGDWIRLRVPSPAESK
jgi:hypothetical protein